MRVVEIIATLLIGAAIVNVLVNGRNTAGVINAVGTNTTSTLKVLTSAN